MVPVWLAFGEDQTRYIIEVADLDAIMKLADHSIDLQLIGQTNASGELKSDQRMIISEKI